MDRNVLNILNSKNKNSKKLLYNLAIMLMIIIGIIGVGFCIERIFNIDIFTFLNDLFLLKYLPKLGNNTSYGLLFIFGILTSFHCIGMCGGIAISQSVRKTELQTEGAGSGRNSFLLPSLFYNLGRVISYTIVGGIVGGLGHVISFSGVWKAAVPIIGGLFMIIMAINLLEVFPMLRRFNIRMPYFVAKRIYKKNNYSPIIVGLLTGLMPCGPLQIVQLYALGTGSIIIGAASMFIFSMGTVPVLFTFGAINTILNKKFSKVILKASAVLVFVLGIVMIGRGLALTGVSMDMPKIINNGKAAVSKVEENSQSVTIKIKADSYPAIVVVKGIPVKWVISVDEEDLNECNNAIQSPKLKIEKNLAVGDNLVEFTPEESGEFAYTCWMGMIKSKITVIDNIDDLKKYQNQEVSNNETETTADSTGSNSKDENKGLSDNGVNSSKTENTGVSTDSNAKDENKGLSDEEIACKIECQGDPGLSNKSESKQPQAETKTTPDKVSPEPTKPANSDTTAKQSFTGYIIDEDCFAAMTQDPGSDTKICLKMSSCAASGYGIAVKQSDGSYKFYFFDGEFAPKASGSQVQAYNLILKTAKKNHVAITVTGILKGNSKTASDGISYPVITVSSLSEN